MTGDLTIRADDVDVLARTIYGEARGEDLDGQIAVAWVAINRAMNPAWWSRDVDGQPDDSIAAVCLKPWQFSAWNADNPNLDAMQRATLAEPEFRDAYLAALGALQGEFADPTHGATHYYATYIDKPDWAQTAKHTITLGDHAFYKDV